MALPTNNRMGWKGLPETNTPAYYKKIVYWHKEFYNIGPWFMSGFKTFFFVTCGREK
jgi:hypothetical protein